MLNIRMRSEWDNSTDIDFSKATKFTAPINKVVIETFDTGSCNGIGPDSVSI